MPISHRQLIHKHKSVFQFNTRYFLFSARGLHSCAIYEEAVKSFICLFRHVGVTRMNTSSYVTPFKFKESSMSPMCINGRRNLECCGASLWPIARHMAQYCTKCLTPSIHLDHRYSSTLSTFRPLEQNPSITVTNLTPFFNEVEQWYVRHNYFIVLLHRQHVSTYIQVIFRPSFTDKSIKCYTCWDPIMLTEVKYEGWKFNSGNYLFTTDTK